MIASRLTCPHLAKDKNMLFHEDDPFAKPLTRIKELSDINSGCCYLESHKALIKKPHEILLQIPMSWDRTELERTGRLSMELINTALGAFNRKTRSLPEVQRATRRSANGLPPQGVTTLHVTQKSAHNHSFYCSQ